MGKLDRAITIAKALTGSNAQSRPIGVELYIDQINKAEPFMSLFSIGDGTLEAIKAAMQLNGFDRSKPVNVWKTMDGDRILVDGYTRIRAAEELGFLKVMAFEMSFKDQDEALAYAVHAQRDRRNISEPELLHLIELVDKPQEGFKTTIAPNGANVARSVKTAELTAGKLGVSVRKVERVRAVIADPVEAEAVRMGKKTIHKAASDIEAKRRGKKTLNVPVPVMVDSKPHGIEDPSRDVVVPGTDMVHQLRELLDYIKMLMVCSDNPEVGDLQVIVERLSIIIKSGMI